MSEAAEQAWVEHRNANSRHNIPYGQSIFMAGFEAAQVVPQPNREALRKVLAQGNPKATKNYMGRPLSDADLITEAYAAVEGHEPSEAEANAYRLAQRLEAVLAAFARAEVQP